MAVRFLFGLSLAALLFEGLLRGFEVGPLWRIMPIVEASFYGPDPYAGYTLRPGANGYWILENRGHHTVNRHGMLDREYQRDPPQGISRIAFFGDSFTEALQVPREQTFVRLTERRLADSNLDIQAMNFGISGATPAVMAARMEQADAMFDIEFFVLVSDAGAFENLPTLVVPGVVNYLPAPAGEFRRDTEFATTPGYEFRTSAAGELVYGMVRHVRLAALANAIKNQGLALEFGAEQKKPPYDHRGQNSVACRDLVNSRLEFWRDGGTDLQRQYMAAFLRDLARIAGERPVLLFVQGLGSSCAGQVEPGLQMTAGTWWLSSDDPAQHNIKIVDLDPVLANFIGAEQPLSSLHGFGIAVGSGHLNTAGHGAYAEIIASQLAEYLAQQNNE